MLRRRRDRAWQESTTRSACREATAAAGLGWHAGTPTEVSGLDSYLAGYAVVVGVFGVGVLFVATALGANRVLAPARPTPDKLLAYECGVDPVGEGWAQTYIRYYVYAYLYVIFAVDAIYLFPWATVFAAPGYGVTTLVEMFVFLGIVAVGILYAARRGVLLWA
jgi:NADH-quinone oxidoreductase subunit A